MSLNRCIDIPFTIPLAVIVLATRGHGVGAYESCVLRSSQFDSWSRGLSLHGFQFTGVLRIVLFD
ncbi:MAG: hypothetical protein CMJ50_05085 [Planctomycetaceae bacterium]|nr:hypothetical protein [Planctomycetaceae bacterium]